ncbi:hypothetical protein K458DRAFT_460656 [Lentithecium fluviatile CBS 122367]|uniref:Uncharacterized protein n=1 Tax=Lentithecium fluviatile CBS 122367 TaxID=1168545 RepID=A0A6G1IPJ7_9PLEO|nr:hypothetical protein K458DRAFT_460656 [Lentithecium fluviatile CBS 122367]
MSPLFHLLSLLLLAGLAIAFGGYHNHAQEYAARLPPPAEIGNKGGENQVAQRWGNFVLVNQCYYDVYVTEARQEWGGQSFKLPARSPLRTMFEIEYDLPDHEKDVDRRCTNNCGVTYKVTREPKLVGGIGGNQLQFEYTSKDGILYYDISFVDCAKDLGHRTGNAENCPGWKEGLQIDGQKGFDCRTMVCEDGKMCISWNQGAYYVDEPEPRWGLKDPIGTCPTYQMEIYFRLCARNPDL